MNESDDLDSQLKRMLNKARRSLAVAKHNVETGDYDFASSRAYYAAFYALEAILAVKNLSFAKHAGVIAAFNQHFIKTAIFPKDYSKIVERLFRDRQTGDYDYSHSLSVEIAEEDLRLAEQLIDSIENYLIENSFLQKKD
jgi:uncharacterized protein (UPF0332 family)